MLYRARQTNAEMMLRVVHQVKDLDLSRLESGQKSCAIFNLRAAVRM